MASFTQLQVYNMALLAVGERQIATIDENRESRRLLDALWAFHYPTTWLEQSDWNWAMRSAKIEADDAFTSAWGFDKGFQQPGDMARVCGVYIDEDMRVPLRDYLDEELYWFADSVDTIYVQYVSNDPAYGGDLCLWPLSFAEYVAAFLAEKIAPTLKNDIDIDYLERKREKYLNAAKSKDGLRNPSKPLPRGSWTRSRLSDVDQERR